MIWILNYILGTHKTSDLRFYELISAYDNVPRPALFRCFGTGLGAHHFVSLIQAIYTLATAKIRVHNKDFSVNNECRKGRIESPNHHSTIILTQSVDDEKHDDEMFLQNGCPKRH